MAAVSKSKRCGCRDDDGNTLGQGCGRLRRKDGSWNPAHGTWAGRVELPPAADGSRVELRAAGWDREADMLKWFDDAQRLMAIPAPAPEGHDDRATILELINQSRRRKESLPDYDDIRRRYQHGIIAAPGTTEEYLLSWLDGLRRSKRVRANTLRGYESHVHRIFIPAFGSIPLERLRLSHVAAAFDRIDQANAEILAAQTSADPAVRKSVAGRRVTGDVTKQRIRATLRAALNDVPSTGGVPLLINPARHLQLASGASAPARTWTNARVADWRERFDAACRELEGPRHTVGQRRRFAVYRDASMRPSPVMVWTPEQAGQFLDHVAEHRLYPLFHLIVFRGFRRGEVCGLRWRDVDLDTARITVASARVQLGWEAVESPVKSAASDGVLAIDTDTVAVVKAWRRTQLAERLAMGEQWTDTGLVFTLEDGTAYHPDRLTDIFEWEAFRAGLPPIRLHDLRHCAASIAHAAGADMKAIQELLRHSSLTITANLYTSVFEAQAAQLAEDMARAVPRRRAVVAGDSAPTDAHTSRTQAGPDARDRRSQR
jgi:integrase